MKDNVYSVAYAGLLGTVCALLLTGVASFTAPYRAENARVEEVLNILRALKVPFEADATSAELLETFEANVDQAERGGITLYRYLPAGAGDRPKAIALRFAGPGLWGPMEGFLALEPDMRTIRGLTFSKQEETPGLGGEIAASWFRDQFVGKSIVGPDGVPGIVIGDGGAPNAVDAITGATMTCDKLQAVLTETAKKFVGETHERQ